jgi:hypothetical protein
MSEPPQRSECAEDHDDKKDHAADGVGETDPRERALAFGCAPPTLRVRYKCETRIHGGRVDRIAHQRPCFEMGREIRAYQLPAVAAVDAPIEPTVCCNNDGRLRRVDPAHGGVRLREPTSNGPPTRAAIVARE